MKRVHKYLLSLASGLLLSAAWPARGFPGLLFIAFVPLLLVELEQWKNRKTNHASAFLPYIAVTISVWVLLTTWWVYNSTPIGIFATVFVNTSLVGGAIWLFHITHRKLESAFASFTGLIAYMLTAEYIHLRWDLNFPWLNLGNGFAAYPSWIQWYEFTGIFGGSLWVLVANIIIFRILVSITEGNRKRAFPVTGLAIATGWIAIPLVFSLFIYHRYSEKPDPVDVVVVQPNIDPYNEQYELDPLEITNRMLAQAASLADSTTQFVVFPESAIQEYVYEDHFDRSLSLARIRKFNAAYPQLATVAGISSRKVYAPGEPVSATARKFRDTTIYYDAYNTAMFVAHSGALQLYHKSKLTPGVEIMPLVKYIKPIEKLALNLGGTVGSLGVNPDQTPYTTDKGLKVAPVICYESVYGEFLNRFVQNGAGVIFVITNDGWWGNTAGHRQHVLFSVLRAVETRRSIARSANTGTSCFINQRGDIMQATPYWEPTAIRQKINANDKITFYVKHGDYIGRFFVIIALLMLILSLITSLRGSRLSGIKR
jgi:apolipoprotein N-acyltransferase